MSWQPAPTPADATPDCTPVETTIVPRARDIGDFEVRRVLPSAKRRMVGPFIFFDQMGPVEFLVGSGMDVRPHPHIGLATITYLMEGEIYHRDSLGTALPIRPGAVNLMTAGSGITHSERSSPEDRLRQRPMLGIQSWIALPQHLEETEPAFHHIPEGTLPEVDGSGWNGKLIAGTYLDQTSPTPTYGGMLYTDIGANAGAKVPLPADHEERAIYVLTGAIEIAGERFDPGQMVILKPDHAIDVSVVADARLLFVGGDAADGPRHIWWNFVSSRKERIEQAKEDWREGRFAAVPEETDFIPLPDN